MQTIHFNDLPRELIERCFSFMPPADIWKNARYVCPLWRAIIEQRRSGWVFEHGRDAIWIGVVKQTMQAADVTHNGFHGPMMSLRASSHGTLRPLPLHDIITQAGETFAVFCHTYNDDRYYNYHIRLPSTRNPSGEMDGIPLFRFRHSPAYWSESGRWYGTWKFRFERVAKGRVTLWLSCQMRVLAMGATSAFSDDTPREYALSSAFKAQENFLDDAAALKLMF